MKFYAMIAVLAISLLTITGCSDTPSATSTNADVAEPYIVRFSESVPASDVDDLVSRLAASYDLDVENIYQVVFKGFSASMPANVVQALRDDRRIESVVPDRMVSMGTPAPFNKPPGGGGVVPRVSPQVISWSVANVGTASGIGKRVWLLDTGIDPNHPDLTIDARLSRNFVKRTGLKTTSWQDEHGHGTNWAGIIGAKNDGYDAVGVAAGCTLIAARAYGADGLGYLSWVYAAMDYIAANTVAGDVVCFWGTWALDAGTDARIRASAANGVTWVVYSGGLSADAMNYSPANTGYNNPNIWTVSGHDEFGSFYLPSNYGMAVDVCAPATNIVTTKLGGGIETVTGGNLAAPHVAGILRVGTMGSHGPVANDPDGDPDEMAKLE